jgi:hypothetical protein
LQSDKHQQRGGKQLRRETPDIGSAILEKRALACGRGNRCSQLHEFDPTPGND